MITQDLGIATAYGYAKSKGYTGTEAEFAELMASYATVGQTAVTAAQTATTKASEAATSATTATNKATEATTAATTATTKAGEASTSASTATSAKDTAVSASQTATTKATEATTAAATATSAATTATTAKDDAVSAKTAAQTAQTGAETAAASVQSSAAQIQTNADDISELKEDFANFLSDENDVSIDINTTLGRVMFSQGDITFDNTSRTFANSYAELEPNKTYKVHIASGYKLYAVLLNSAETTALYDNTQFGVAWISGDETIEFTTTPTWHYFRCSLMRADSGLMINDDLESIATLSELGTTIFALKTTVAEVSGAVDELENALNDFASDRNDIPIDINTTLGRVMFSQGDITFDDTSRTFANSYADLEPNKTYKVHISSGYKIYAVLADSSATTALYDQSQFGGAWITGEQTITFTPTNRWHYFRCSLMRNDSGLMINDDLESIADLVKIETTIFATKTALAELREDVNNSNLCLLPSGGQILYNADTKASGDYIVNALAYDDGVIIACRANGNVVRIGYDGTEETLLSISGSGFDWRLCWKDSNDNVYVSPHASWGSMAVADRGLYKLTKGASAFIKVISLYDTSSTAPTERENNNDTIWTMCEDASGNLYAGVYAHTIHANPAIYKSTDGGDTWTYLYNFNTSGLTTGGRHIHVITYSQWKDALYCIVGEINTIFKSVDGGTTWTNLNIALREKGSSMLATPNGLLVGSDGAYNCEIDWIHSDDTTHETVFSGWANTVFAIRRSDLTGFVYAFTKIDSSVTVEQYMPPYGVLYGTQSLEAWKAGDYTSGVAPTHLAEWEAYNASVKDKYPDDALRPQHFAILVSRNGGSIWEVLKAIPCDSRAAYGIWTIGQFRNGECLCGVYTGNYNNGSFVSGVTNPMVISEGKHKYVATGCDLDGEIFVRTNASSVVSVI